MTPLLNNGPISEHCGYPNGLDLGNYIQSDEHVSWSSLFFKGDEKKCCLELRAHWNGKRTIHSSYYIGADWLEKGKLAVYIEPKLNNEERSTDFYRMLFDGLSNEDIGDHFSSVFDMKTGEPEIELPHQLDLLTPLLVYQFLKIMKAIVSKGLKKSYYPVTEDLNNRIKGKIMIPRQIRQNNLKNRPLHHICQYHEFGINGLENRILKKALNFALRYLNSFRLKEYRAVMEALTNYITPAFETVSDSAHVNDIQNIRINPFFKEYREGLRLAKMLFQRYGYNINTIETRGKTVKVPPFWIDMSKLYELYVLSKLRKESYGRFIKFQVKGKYGYPDFLLCLEGSKAVIDAKYKPRYHEKYEGSDIRQLSGYARDKGVLKALGITAESADVAVVDCIIIYPLRDDNTSGSLALDALKGIAIDDFTKFHRKSVELPFLKAHDI
jgi:5-methylcytosine-specific restriction enzyme subunit McrC